MTPNTDAPNTDAPDSADDYSYDSPNADDDAAYPKLIYISLRNCNRNLKIAPNSKKQFKKHDPQH